MRGAIARFRRRRLWGLPAADVALAGTLCVVAVVSVLTGNPDEGSPAVTLPVAIASTLALVWRRTRPPVTIALLIVTGVAQTLLTQVPGSLWSLAVYVIAMYSLAAWTTEAVAAFAGAVFVVVLLVEERLASGVDYVFILLLFGGVWLLGRASRSWRGRVRVAEHGRQEAARLATAEERLRIARDLHDVVAHSLGAIAVQADAAEAALHVAPERAVEPVRAIRETARVALADIRRVLDVLRNTDEDGVDTAGIEGSGEGTGTGVGGPGIAAVAPLIAAARASGMTVALHLSPAPVPAPQAVELACYRIVQEGLTNARRHAPGASVTVEVDARADAVVVSVVNDRAPAPVLSRAPSSSPGLGLRGMQERVTALGGALVAGPSGDGGFAVRAEIPLRESAS
ncbi:sensor histidine kinase [Microbacterium terrisoli]|jgi:signal transduction histidine kinase|uniref:sensor histidine kinase n=1 Tax=Microbacterium terrisoli TaxID=3242192 RepID=UPI0028065B9B|nr:histidine kinase [Microbacterium protaetiae]